MDKKLYWLWLTTQSWITSSDITALFDQFNSVEEIYEATDYSHILGIKAQVKLALRNKSLKNAENILTSQSNNGVDILTYDDINYPDILRTIDNPPYVLYQKGEMMNWDRLLMLGVVGTRSCTDYGIAAVRRICPELAENGITIVAGMAEGIDTEAAKAAICAGGKTIAVLGSGIDVPYPPQNKGLMNEIAKNGAVITEYPPGTRPIGKNFPWRNRIISGLSRGTLVIEAPRKSGALITANYALNQGRDVFAVPGSILKPSCEGTNKLLTRYAKSVTEANDILEEYTFELQRLQGEKPKKNILKNIFTAKDKESVNTEMRVNLSDKKYQSLTEDEKKIIMLLIDKNRHIDDIIRESGLEMSELSPILSMLELGGYIQKIPGNNYKINIR